MKPSAIVLGLGTALVSLNGFAASWGLNNHIYVDRSDDSTDGFCQRGLQYAPQCNLRAAIREALTQDGTVVDIRTDLVISQGSIAIDPDRATNLVVRGVGGSELKALTGSANSRLFEINDKANVRLNGVLISNFSAWEGGAILNAGTLELQIATLAGNKASCSGGGAMTATASCFGGAISNNGTLILKDDTRFENNEVSATASTASYTTANASGGAISSNGTIIIDGAVVFDSNRALTSANSGVHPMPFGGAFSSAFGGAVASNGSLEVSESGAGKCIFARNLAKAEGTTPFGEVSLTSRGGAAFVSGATSFTGAACVFTDNDAAEDRDLAFQGN